MTQPGRPTRRNCKSSVPEGHRKGESLFGKLTLGPGYGRTVAELPAWKQRVRTNCLRESRQIAEVGRENLREKNAYFQVEETCVGHVGGIVLWRCDSCVCGPGWQ